MTCPFCELIVEGTWLCETTHAVAIADAFPLTPGHSLVLPRRHEPDFFALDADEREAVFPLAWELKLFSLSAINRTGSTSASTSVTRPGRPSAMRICTSSRGIAGTCVNRAAASVGTFPRRLRTGGEHHSVRTPFGRG